MSPKTSIVRKMTSREKKIRRKTSFRPTAVINDDSLYPCLEGNEATLPGLDLFDISDSPTLDSMVDLELENTVFKSLICFFKK